MVIIYDELRQVSLLNLSCLLMLNLLLSISFIHPALKIRDTINS